MIIHSQRFNVKINIYLHFCFLVPCGGKKCVNGGTINVETCACACEKDFEGETCQNKSKRA